MKTKLLLTLIIALYSLSLSAQIITDRPDQTESSSTVPSGALQIESGVVLAYNGDNFSDREILAPTTLFRYGLNKNFELRLVSQFESLKNGIQSNSGISDLEIGTKVQIYQKEGSNTEIAFLTHLLVPSGSKELTLDNYASINKISIAHDLSENASFGYNIGYDYFGEGNGNITYSAALGVSVNDKLGIYIEPYGELADVDEFVLNFDSGFTYLLADNFQLDFSFGTGITHRMNYLSFGCSWLVERNKK